MSDEKQYDHVLIRDGTILVRIRRGPCLDGEDLHAEFFDLRTGVQLRELHPPFQSAELQRCRPLTDEALAVLIGGSWLGSYLSVDFSKVVSILEVKQRKLDSVVADSVLEQLALITDLLREFLDVAASASKEERFWMSQQVLTVVRKFSGRELEELRGIVDWLRSHRKR